MREEKNTVEKALSALAEVRAGEGAAVLLLGLNVFLLLAAYYLLKTVRESLILSESGAEVKSYSSAAQAILLLLVVPAYGWLTARMGRMRVITCVLLIFAANLVMFYFAGVAGAREGVVFFIWAGIFNNFVVAQFWSFANDLYSEPQGKRLFPIIGIGTSAGALLGAVIAAPFIRAAGPYPLMLAAAATLLVCILLTRIVHYRAKAQPHEFHAGPAEEPLAKGNAFALIFRDRYLLLIAGLILLLNVVNTSGEFLLGKLVTMEARHVVGLARLAQQKFIGGFYAEFFSWVNLIGLLVQMFGVSRLFRYFGVRGSLFILPAIGLVNYSLLLFIPVLAIIRVGKIIENSTDYSLMNTLRHALYLPTSREAKYKAKSAIDTFFVRSGDVISAGFVFAGTQLGFAIRGFSLINIVLAFLWIAVAIAIGRHYRARTAALAAAA